MRSFYVPHERVQKDPYPTVEIPEGYTGNIDEYVERENGKHVFTKQEFGKDADINNIMRKYERGQIIDHVARVQGRYGDFIDAPDFQSALNQVIEAQEMFDTLPASVRERFGNDPAKFLDFAQNQDNLDEMREMGLALPSRGAVGADMTPQEDLEVSPGSEDGETSE